MEDLIWDGVPAQRKKREEKFSFPVVTLAALDKPGAGRKFIFNKAAQELLNIQGEERISFGFSSDRSIIAVRKAADINSGIQLTKTCTISDKKTYEFIAKILNLDTSVENNFEIVPQGNLNILQLHVSIPVTENVIIEEAENNFEVTEEQAVMPEPEAIEEEVEEDFSDVEVSIDDMPFALDPEFSKGTDDSTEEGW
jgi:hypothetical protein